MASDLGFLADPAILRYSAPADVCSMSELGGDMLDELMGEHVGPTASA
jgi:hypothetical protein